MATTQLKDGFNGGSDNQLKINIDGSINVTGSSASNPAVGPTEGPVPAAAIQIGGVTPEGNLQPLSVDDAGRLNVNTDTTVTNTVKTQEAGLNSFKTSQYSVGVTEIQITPSPLTNRSSISLKVQATGANAIYICQTAGQALTQGYPLFNGDNLQMDLTPSGTIFAVSTAPGQNLYVLEIA